MKRGNHRERPKQTQRNRRGEPFHESPQYIGKRLDRPIAILRHDIDLDVDKALIMAEIESNMGVCSCFMFLTNCAFYSIEDDSVSSAIRSIKEMGHDIGIHYDINQDKNSTIEIECSRLEDILNSVVKSISFHRPISEYLNGPIYIGDRVNTYASDLMNNYLSDSKGIWREGEPLTMIENYRNKITTAFDQFNVDLNKYREEVNKIIEDIRKEYDVTKIS